MSKLQDQNKDNNGALLLRYEGDGKYSLAGQGQKVFYEKHGWCSKNVWVITRSSFNTCNYIDFTLDDLTIFQPSYSFVSEAIHFLMISPVRQTKHELSYFIVFS